MRLLLLLPLAGCLQWSFQTTPDDCDARLLEIGEVRLRRIPCNDELQPGGEGHVRDWVLENAQVRFIIRDGPFALSAIDRAGGTIIDAAPPGVSDGLVEATPTIGGRWFVDATLHPGEGPGELVVEGLFEDGSAGTLTYRLYADSQSLALDGADGLELRPAAGAEVVGGLVEARYTPNSTLVYATDTQPADSGGTLRWEAPGRLFAGRRPEVIAARWPDSRLVEGAAEGDWVELFAGLTRVARAPIVDGAFAAAVPGVVDGMRAIGEGFAPGPVLPIDSATPLPLGAPGSLLLEVVDDQGRAIPATLRWNGQDYPLQARGGALPTGPGSGEAWIWAGPAYEQVHLPNLVVDGELRQRVMLRALPTIGLWADLDVPAWPGPVERAEPSLLARQAAGRGVGLIALIAEDEVAIREIDDHDAPWIRARSGSRPGVPDFDLRAWSFGWTNKRPGHGAVDWRGLDPVDLLAAMGDQGSRYAVADLDWVEAAGPTWGWDPAPDALMIDGLEDAREVRKLLGSRPIRNLVGPLTFLPGVPRDAADVFVTRAFATGETTATNGPTLSLQRLAVNPTPLLDDRRKVPMRLVVDSPDWMPLDRLILYEGTSKREEIDLRRATGHPRYAENRWVYPRGVWTAAVEGPAAPPFVDEPVWAVTSPVWP